MKLPYEAHTDIATNGWLSSIPNWLQPFAIIARLDRPIGWWLLLLPGWWAILAHPNEMIETAKLMSWFLGGAIIMRSAGCIINDLWDRDIDKQVARTAMRPLAAGTISVRSAIIFLGIMLLVGFFILLQLPFKAWIMGLSSIPLIICYPLAKRVTKWPQVVLGLAFSWGVLLGAVSATNNWPSDAMLLVYAGTACWIIGYDTIYAIQDKEDDAKLGIGSAARSFGTNLSKGITALYLAAILLWSAGFWLQFGLGFWLFGIAGSALHLGWQIYKLSEINGKSALAVFRSNRDCGLVLAAGLLLQDLF